MKTIATKKRKARVSESLADLRAGRVRTFTTARTLMKKIKAVIGSHNDVY